MTQKPRSLNGLIDDFIKSLKPQPVNAYLINEINDPIIDQFKASLIDYIDTQIIGEDEKIQWDDYKDNVALTQATNALRAQQRANLNKTKEKI